MKKCPKCGTILDDSKKKCYMCGTDLQKNNITNFGDVFDTQVGATVTKGQDNVFNNVGNISANVDDVFNGNNKDDNNMTFTQKSSSADFYKDQMNSLNSMQYDERTALEKIFSGDSRFRSRDEINAEDAMKKNREGEFNTRRDSNSFYDPFGNNNDSNNNQNNNVNNLKNNSNDNLTSGFNINGINNVVNNNFPNNTIDSNVVNNTSNESISSNIDLLVNKDSDKGKKDRKEFFKKKNRNEEKPKINWGDNLSPSNNVSGYKDKVDKKFSINFSFIFNTICFFTFLGGMLFVYFKYIKPENDRNVNFGGLNYSINEDFVLKSNDTYSKYYTRGDSCSIRISYGYTNNVSNYVDEYFEQIKNDFTEEKGYTSVTEDLKINDNMWNSLSILQLDENAAGTGGYAPNVKFKYISIVYKGNFYNITYSNTRNDNECSSGFDQLLESLAFD